LGTYVLPTLCFPAAVRSTCHGISAFGGKCGAVVGTLLFMPVFDSLGIECVMWIELVVSILGMLVSYGFLKNDWEYDADSQEQSAASTTTEIECSSHSPKYRSASVASTRPGSSSSGSSDRSFFMDSSSTRRTSSMDISLTTAKV
jgi:hypothetical protein